MRKYWILAVFLALPALVPASISAQTRLPNTQPPGAGMPPAATLSAPPAPGVGGMSIYTAATVNDFLAACRADQAGCMAQIGSAFLTHMNDDGDDTVCLNDVNYGRPVPAWLDSHPETHTMPTENGIYLALQKLYPCNNH
jgi:hypothetical protein